MKLRLVKNETAHVLQEEFSKIFPYLKIEFFSRPHKAGKGTHRRYQLDGGSVSGLRPKQGSLDLSPSMKVKEFEESFSETFGLPVQVFRKSGKAWLETTVTDSWTLGQQNREGMELSANS